MVAEQLRRAIEAAPRVELPKVSALLWKAYAVGTVSESDAADLSNLIEARKAIPAAQKAVQRRLGSRPRIACLNGTTPLLGRFRGPTARPGEPVHHGGERCASRDCGRAGPVTAKVCVLAKALRNTKFVKSATPDPQQNQALRPFFPRAPGGEVSRDTIVVRSTVRPQQRASC